MKRQVMFAGLSLLCAALASSSYAIEVKVDTQSASEMLSAISNHDLDREQALRVAKLPGNQGLITKAHSYDIPITTETFADELVKFAHGVPSDTPTAHYLHLENLKTHSIELSALIVRIKNDPVHFQDWVIERVKKFSPKDSTANINGYLLMGGSSGGFAFGKPVFYLNLAYFSDFDTAKVVMAHELYHAVQGFHSVEHSNDDDAPDGAASKLTTHQQMCANLTRLFGSLYAEGSASYVGDVLLLPSDGALFAIKTRNEMESGLQSIKQHVTILDLSVTGIEAPTPVPYSDIYAVDFYLPEPLYKVGYVMAKAIATDEGSDALTAHLTKPGYAFTQHYLNLALYGKDNAHPKLGDNAVNAVKLLDGECR